MSSIVTLDDVSPLISYRGPWRAGSLSSDPLYFSDYSNNGTYTLTTSNSATATIEWYGTGIEVFGAKRTSHNVYSMALDGNKPRFIDGNGPDLFGQSLFHVQNLENGPHKLVIQDASQSSDPDLSFFDIDYVNLETQHQNSVQLVNIEDTDPTIQYEPVQTSWNTHSPLVADLHGVSLHVTTEQNATATFLFSGSAFDLYGIVCPDCGQYAVSVDDGPETTFNAKNTVWTLAGQVLYVARGLDDGAHRLLVRNIDGALGIDYAAVSGNTPGAITAPATASSTTASTSASGSTTLEESASQTAAPSAPADSAAATPSGRKLPVGAVVGGVLALLLFFLAVAIFVVFLMRRRRTQRRRKQGPCAFLKSSDSMVSPVTPGALASPFIIPASPSELSYMSGRPLSLYDVPLTSPTPASIRNARSPSPVPLFRPLSRVDAPRSELAYDQETLSSPATVLVLHEAPPAYDGRGCPPSITLTEKR